MRSLVLGSLLSWMSHFFSPVLVAEERRVFDSDAVLVRSELGVLGVINHRLRYSHDNTQFNYMDEGGQDHLTTFQRYSADMQMDSGDLVRFVYQPLEWRARTALEREIRVNDVAFARGTPMQFVYSFPYYRGSYLWETLHKDRFTLHLGLGLQIRNARTEFMTVDGQTLVSNRRVGPVPVLALALQYRLSPRLTLEFEAEGNDASPTIFKGDDQNEISGAILDSGLKFAAQINQRFKVFGSLRYISGGSRGTTAPFASDASGPGSEGYSSNWINMAAASLGVVANLDAF